MADSYAKKIQWKIEKMDPGSVFVRSDFAEIADGETLRRNLNRLTENGTLYRVQKGVYEKPKFNARLGEKVATDPQKVAKALARGYHWTIVPAGKLHSINWGFLRRFRRCGVTSAMGRIEAIAGIEQSWSSDTGQTVRSAE